MRMDQEGAAPVIGWWRYVEILARCPDRWEKANRWMKETQKAKTSGGGLCEILAMGGGVKKTQANETC